MKAYPFLHKHPTSGQTTMSEGMDLRDWFAGVAMQTLLLDRRVDMQDDAREAYKMADLMMKQREVQHEQS